MPNNLIIVTVLNSMERHFDQKLSLFSWRTVEILLQTVEILLRTVEIFMMNVRNF